MRMDAFWDTQKLPGADSKTINHQRQNLVILFVVAVKKFAYAHIWKKKPQTWNMLITPQEVL